MIPRKLGLLAGVGGGGSSSNADAAATKSGGNANATPASLSASSTTDPTAATTAIPNKTTVGTTPTAGMAVGVGLSSLGTTSLADFAKWVPLRLTREERSLLTVLEQALNVSEYTDHVDVAPRAVSRGFYGSSSYNNGGSLQTAANKTRRILDGILELCHIATGLAVCSADTQQEKHLQHLCFLGDPTTTASARSVHSSTSSSLPSSSTAAGKSTAVTTEGLTKKQQRLLAKMEKKEKKLARQALLKKNRRKKNKNDAAADSNGNRDAGAWSARDPADNAALFQTMFEIGRRNKVLNPSTMRATYGKLMYLLQDAQNPTVAKSLGFSLHKDLLLVKPWLTTHGCADLLDDPRLECAVQYVSDRDPVTGQRLPRDHVAAMVQGKITVTEQLMEHYCVGGTHPSSLLSKEDVKRAIESLADAVQYVEMNVRPVQRMLQYLQENFHPTHIEPGFSLALRGGKSLSSSPYGSSSSVYNRYGLSSYGSSGSNDGGPTLSHSHSTQYTFVWQSLRLWSKVMRHMHRLWICADDDLLSTVNTYHLYNTGQGLNRVQTCPKVRKVMQTLLHQTQQECGGTWVGLSVIHLGDRDVPNALIFIDKYTQIPRFLNPIVSFLQALDNDELATPGSGTTDTTNGTQNDSQQQQTANILQDYIVDQFESKEKLKLTVLSDYFKHGFDGSGDDGGSCIDGRLTSSWNWTSRLAKKSYYHAFLLVSGFQGFDGDFR